MLNDEEATRAIRELNGVVLNGNRLNVEVFIVVMIHNHVRGLFALVISLSY